MNAAHLHLVLNHIPVLGAIISFVLVLAILVKKDPGLKSLSLWWFVLIGALGAVVYLTGEPAEESVEHLSWFQENFVERHEDTALWALIVTEVLALMGVFGLYLQKKKHTTPVSFWRVAIVVAGINLAFMGWTANLGGQIRHTEIRDTQPGQH